MELNLHRKALRIDLRTLPEDCALLIYSEDRNYLFFFESCPTSDKKSLEMHCRVLKVSKKTSMFRKKITQLFKIGKVEGELLVNVQYFYQKLAWLRNDGGGTIIICLDKGTSKTGVKS